MLWRISPDAPAIVAGYRETLREDRRRLFDRFELKDIAIKVVGVGSVGDRSLLHRIRGAE